MLGKTLSKENLLTSGSVSSPQLNSKLLSMLQAIARDKAERAVCGEFCVLIGYPSGQDGAILPVSFPQIKFRQSSSECTKVFSR